MSGDAAGCTHTDGALHVTVTDGGHGGTDPARGAACTASDAG
ncbi:hypothetical protein ACWCXH_18195 [Kitasatospora sp. NPDC001660]